MVSALRSGATRKTLRTKTTKSSSSEPAAPSTRTKRRGKKRAEQVPKEPAMETSTAVEPEQSGEEANKTSEKNSPVNKTIQKTKGRSTRRRRTTAGYKNAKEAQRKGGEVSALKTTVPFAGIEKSIVDSAVEALMKDFKSKHHDANDNETAGNTVRLVDDVSKVSLVFNLKVPPSKSRFKPKRIQLKHSLYEEQSDICMFVKDPADMVTRVLDKSGYGGVTRVMGLAELKTDFNTHERRRTLASTYDLFLCDSRVIPSMPKLLGNFFSKTKKTPLEVDLNRKLPDVIERAVKSTSLHLPEGTCTTVHIGTTNLTAAQLIENVHDAALRVFNAVENGADNVQSVHIKTTKSQSLPLYVSLPTPVHIAPKVKEDDDYFTLEDLNGEKNADEMVEN